MTLRHTYTILVKRWLLVVICCFVLGLGAYVGSILSTPLYKSTALIQITIRSQSNQADINSLLASDQLVQTEAQLAVSDPVLREVASHYPGLTVERLAKQVTATPRLNTQLFEINVVDANPKRAADIANDIVATLINLQQQIMQQNNSQSQQQIRQDLDATQAQIDSLTTQIDELKSTALRTQKGTDAQIADLAAQQNGLQQHNTQLQSSLTQLELTEAENGNFLEVAQAAQPGTRPVQPDILLNTSAGLATGLFLGILLAILLEELSTQIRTPEAVTQLVERPVLATVWRVPQPVWGTGSDHPEALIHPTGKDANVESYRILRTSIGFSSVDKPLHSLVVTSALPYDGKSVVAANLAIFMAKAGKRTLLIDGDLRRPTLHEKFGLSPDKQGLSNAIMAFSVPTMTNVSPESQILSAIFSAGQPPADELLTKVALANTLLDPFIHAVDIPNLRVMPSGPLPPNPSELLDSKAMERLFAAIASYGADIVIFDTPPVLGLSDASILASKVDGTLVVVDITRATKGSLGQVKTLLEQAGAHVPGYVINKQRRSRKDFAYSYYYYRSDGQHDENNHRTNNTHPAPTPHPADAINRVPTAGAPNAAEPTLRDSQKGKQHGQ